MEFRAARTEKSFRDARMCNVSQAEQSQSRPAEDTMSIVSSRNYRSLDFGLKSPEAPKKIAIDAANIHAFQALVR
jgi:hypothetical protein